MRFNSWGLKANEVYKDSWNARALVELLCAHVDGLGSTGISNKSETSHGLSLHKGDGLRGLCGRFRAKRKGTGLVSSARVHGG